MVNWKAVAAAIVTSFVLGLLGGLALPFTGATVPVVGAGLSGLVAGAVAGYVNRNGFWSGAVHGFLGTTIGGLVLGALLLVVATLGGGAFLGVGGAVFGFGAGVLSLVVVVATGVPGALGGALGGMLVSRQEPMGRPAA
ncbi:MAG: DUF5518 domain-containing protein [Haloarculaceae archaeon]